MARDDCGAATSGTEVTGDAALQASEECFQSAGAGGEGPPLAVRQEASHVEIPSRGLGRIIKVHRARSKCGFAQLGQRRADEADRCEDVTPAKGISMGGYIAFLASINFSVARFCRSLSSLLRAAARAMPASGSRSALR